MECFNKYINKDGPIIDKQLGSCWCWCGAMNGRTGVFRYKEKTYTPQRMVLFLYKNISLTTEGKIERLCNRITCINPEHLYYN